MIATAEKEKAGGQPGNFDTTKTRYAANFGTEHAEEKAFIRLQAAFSENGHRLTRTTNHDGTVSLFAGCGLYERELSDLDAAKRFLMQIGGDQ